MTPRESTSECCGATWLVAHQTMLQWACLRQRQSSQTRAFELQQPDTFRKLVTGHRPTDNMVRTVCEQCTGVWPKCDCLKLHGSMHQRGLQPHKSRPILIHSANVRVSHLCDVSVISCNGSCSATFPTLSVGLDSIDTHICSLVTFCTHDLTLGMIHEFV